MKLPSKPLTVRAKLLHRLSRYWQMEAANVFAVPLMMAFFSRGQLGWPAAIAIVPMSGMLVVGTIYLRGQIPPSRL